MRVITSLFSAGREGTDKSEGVPTGRWAAFGRCVIMWASERRTAAKAACLNRSVL